jgi:predicted nucleotidyltransferase
MVVLFGSYASGTQTSSSDIDVAVIVEHIKGDFLDQEAGLYKKRREIDDRIEPILLEDGDDPSGFLNTIVTTGEIVYRR